MAYESKPNRNSFLLYRFLWSAFGLTLFILFIGFGVAAFTAFPFWPFVIAWPVFLWWSWFKRSIKYKKEVYQFLDDRIVAKHGTVFSDGQTELLIKNITSVAMRLPWLEGKLFGTGTISIQSAGSGLSEVTLVHMDKPREFFDYVRKIMQRHGFKLKQDKVIQEETPHPIGVLMETFGIGLGSGIGALFVLGPLIPGIAFVLTTMTDSVYAILFALIAIFVGIIIFVWFIGGIFLHYMDRKKRVYTLYSDTVTYHEGFLTTNHAFIPVENISDSENTQGLISRILGIFDVKISCQGTGQEILFSNMENGKKFSENLDNIVDSDRQEVKKPVKAKTDVRPRKKADRSFTGTYKMSAKRYFASALFVIPIFVLVVIGSLLGGLPVFLGVLFGGGMMLIFIFGIIAVGAAIQIHANSWELKNNSVREVYDFLRKNEVEFSNEKIMGVVIDRNPLDRWLNTVNVTFWSIGSSASINMKYIPYTEELVNGILGKMDITRDKELETWNAEYSLGALFMRSYFLIILFIILTIGCFVVAFFMPWVILIPIVIFILAITLALYLHIPMRRRKLFIHSDYVHMQKGYFFQTDYYAPWENVKDMKSSKIPAINKGKLTFNIAGEHVVQTQNSQGAAMQSNSFSMPFVTDIFSKHDDIDTKLSTNNGSKKSDITDPHAHYRQALGNSMFSAIVTIIFVCGFIGFGGGLLGWALSNDNQTAGYIVAFGAVSFAILLAVLILVLTVLDVKFRRFGLDNRRAFRTEGVITKEKTSVVYSRIDHITKHQGFLNKMFKNGNVMVHTAGTTSLLGPELSAIHVKEFNEFYEKLKNAYT